MRSFYAIATLSGTIIGAGLFALPYITLRVGFWMVLAYFLILGSLITIIHLFFGELSLKTPDFKRLPSFAKIYLGNWGQTVAYFLTIISHFGAILVYLILGGEFITGLVAPGANPLSYTLLYFIFGAALIFFGIKAIGKVELWGLVAFVVVLFIIFFVGAPSIDIENLFIGQKSLSSGHWSICFLPYGVILFSLWGANLIPEIEEMLGEHKKKLLKLIPVAILIPVFVYLFFIFIVLGINGQNTTDNALIGLSDVLGGRMAPLVIVFGLLTTFTSFIALGLNLKKVFWYDLKISKNLAWLITCFVPLLLYFVTQDFIKVISFVGAVMLAIEGVLIVLMYRKFKIREGISAVKKLAICFLILVLLGGIIYSVMDLIYFSCI